MRSLSPLVLALISNAALAGHAPLSPYSRSCESLEVPMPLARSDERDFDRQAFYRDGILFLFSIWVPEITDAVGPNDDTLVIPCGKLPPAVQVAVINSKLPDGRFDYNRFRGVLGTAYLEARAKKHPTLTPPPTLAEFKKISGYQSWPVEIINQSRVKNLTRALYHSPKGAGPELSVAVTHDSKTGDITTPVRETEIVLKREDGSKNWDFYVYDGAGRLVSSSHFGNSSMPSPSICMNCHYNGHDRAFVPLVRPQ
jgi:hypothetical protein